MSAGADRSEGQRILGRFGVTKRVRMHTARTSRLLVLIPALSLLVCVSSLGAADAPTKVAPAPAVAPELARFNDLLAGLAESLKPAIVHVRVRRAAVTRERERED